MQLARSSSLLYLIVCIAESAPELVLIVSWEVVIEAREGDQEEQPV